MRPPTALCLLLVLLLHVGHVVAQQQQQLQEQHAGAHPRRSRHNRVAVIARSIADSHPHGGNRTCAEEQFVRAWLPTTFRQEDGHKHMHLLLAVSDNQLVHLVNFLAIAFTMKYLPNPRVLIHFSCHGHISKLFVERYLESECHPRPKRITSANETLWQHIVKDRFGSFLEIIQSLDDSDAGAMTFDLDSVWIRNMVPVFDTFSSSYDFISQGTMREGQWKGRVLCNFGGAYIKNSPAGQALASTAWQELNSAGLELEMPDQDYISRALFDIGKASQRPLPEFSFTRSSLYSNNHCTYYPDTCTNLASGVNGSFSLGNASSHIVGAYLFLPQLVAPTDCSHVCSSSTLLFQHCGIAKCTLEGANAADNTGGGELPCLSIPEFIVTAGNLHSIAKEIPPLKKFKTHHDVFDSARLSHMIVQVEKFINKTRAVEMCSVYSKVCKMTSDGFVISEA